VCVDVFFPAQHGIDFAGAHVSGTSPEIRHQPRAVSNKFRHHYIDTTTSTPLHQHHTSTPLHQHHTSTPLHQHHTLACTVTAAAATLHHLAVFIYILAMQK
jgi:hypothetical protein